MLLSLVQGAVFSCGCCFSILGEAGRISNGGRRAGGSRVGSRVVAGRVVLLHRFRLIKTVERPIKQRLTVRPWFLRGFPQCEVTFQLRNLPSAEPSNCETFQLRNLSIAEPSNCEIFQLRNLQSAETFQLQGHWGNPVRNQGRSKLPETIADCSLETLATRHQKKQLVPD